MSRIPPSLLREATRAGPLESPWLAAGLAALLVASVVMAVRRHRRRTGSPWRRRWPARAGLAAWLATLTTLTGLAGLNAYVGYIPTLPALFGQVPTTSGRNGSQVVRVVIGAPTLDVPPSPALIYLPPAYDSPANAGRRYPVVYLLHGYPGSPLDWSGPSPPSRSWTPCWPTT
jgi:hypothetical protein